MRLYLCLFAFVVLGHNALSQSQEIWVKSYDIRSNKLKGLIEDTLKTIELMKLLNRGYMPVMTVNKKHEKFISNDSLSQNNGILIEYKLELQKIDAGITAKPAKIGVTRFKELEIVLILYAFNGLIPMPGQSRVSTYSINEIIEMYTKQPFTEVEVCTIFWDGKSYYYASDDKNSSR